MYIRSNYLTIPFRPLYAELVFPLADYIRRLSVLIVWNIVSTYSVLLFGENNIFPLYEHKLYLGEKMVDAAAL